MVRTDRLYGIHLLLVHSRHRKLMRAIGLKSLLDIARTLLLDY